jgi:hypothetical protein
MEFALFFDVRHRVLLVRFGKVLSQPALERMQAAVRRFAAESGPCPGILDLGAVEEVTIQTHFIANLARQGAVLSGQRRVLVAPRDETFGLSRMFGLYQAGTGDEPFVFRTLAQAYTALGIDEPDFRPVDAA